MDSGEGKARSGAMPRDGYTRLRTEPAIPLRAGNPFLTLASAARSLAPAWVQRPTRCASSALSRARTPPST